MSKKVKSVTEETMEKIKASQHACKCPHCGKTIVIEVHE